MSPTLLEIAKRLRAYRLGAGLSAEEMAARLHVSRAAFYRYEKYGVNQVEVLERIGKMLNVSVASLLGAGVEYTSNIATYLERYRQIEEDADGLFVLFGPIAYVFTSNEYDEVLSCVIAEELSRRIQDSRCQQITANILDILRKRKATYHRRSPAITTLISASDICRFAKHEFAAEDALVNKERLAVAHRELVHIANLFQHPPLGAQLGIVFDRLPTTSFSIARRHDRSTLLISPFRLGPQINICSGVAMITSAEEAVKLHHDVSRELWARAVTGEQAAHFIHLQITEAARYHFVPHQAL